jgi:hypothetical protein
MSATRRPGSPLRWLAILFCCLGAPACGPGADDIVELTLQTLTGDKGSDQDMFLCYAREAKSTRFECLEISSSGNDFEENHSENFELEPENEIATDESGASPTGIESIVFENRGGGFGSNGWDLAGFELRALYGDDSTETICVEMGTTTLLNSGDKYDPPSCP